MKSKIRYHPQPFIKIVSEMYTDNVDYDPEFKTSSYFQ